MKICKRVFMLRLNSHFTQEEIGRRLGISQSTYSEYETGKRDFNTAILLKLADVYDVSMDYLLCLNEKK